MSLIFHITHKGVKTKDIEEHVKDYTRPNKISRPANSIFDQSLATSEPVLKPVHVRSTMTLPNQNDHEKRKPWHNINPAHMGLGLLGPDRTERSSPSHHPNNPNRIYSLKLASERDHWHSWLLLHRNAVSIALCCPDENTIQFEMLLIFHLNVPGQRINLLCIVSYQLI